MHVCKHCDRCTYMQCSVWHPHTQINNHCTLARVRVCDVLSLITSALTHSPSKSKEKKIERERRHQVKVHLLIIDRRKQASKRTPANTNNNSMTIKAEQQCGYFLAALRRWERCLGLHQVERFGNSPLRVKLLARKCIISWCWRDHV